jgi:hypothetical protein
MNHNLSPAMIAVLFLVTASVACVINLGGPETPAAPIPVSTEAVASLEEVWQGAVSASQDDGTITLVLNETQVTSMLAFRLQEQENPILQDPQVYLRDDQIQVFGTIRRNNIEATASIVLAVQIDPEGVPRFELQSADFGPFPVPDGLLDGLSAVIDEAFTGSVGPAATGLRIESISIDGGLLAITGRIR